MSESLARSASMGKSPIYSSEPVELTAPSATGSEPFSSKSSENDVAEETWDLQVIGSKITGIFRTAEGNVRVPAEVGRVIFREFTLGNDRNWTLKFSDESRFDGKHAVVIMGFIDNEVQMWELETLSSREQLASARKTVVLKMLGWSDDAELDLRTLDEIAKLLE